MNTQYKKNLKAVATACKNYTDKKIDDLKWELGSHTLDVESDTTTAYTKTVPSGAIKCNINKIGGMSYKSVNVWDEQWELGYYDSQGIKKNADNCICSKNYISVLPNTTYYCKTNVQTGLIFRCYDNNENFLITIAPIKNTTFTTPNNCYFVTLSTYGVDNITTYNNDICINVSNSSINGNYYPYFEGIRDSAVTSVVSKDSNATTLDTLTIPAEVQALSGYGWGVNDTCYNYIDFEAKKFIQKVGKVDLGTLNYTYDNSLNMFLTTLSAIEAKRSTNHLISNNYYDSGTSSAGIDKSYFFGSSNIAFRDSDYTNATAFKTAMSGVFLYYELETPVETDISEYIDNNSIVVEPNGTITFNNTYNQAVPSEIDYLIEEVKA